LQAAGQISSLFAQNVLPYHQARLDTVDKASDSATYNSNSVSSLFSANPVGNDQASLQKAMGSKMRFPRSLSCDPSPAAGQYHEAALFAEADGRLRTRQFAKAQTRSQGAMSIAPRTDDPVASLRITDSKKGFVDPHSVISQEATRQSIRWNQTLYRFELKAADKLSCGSGRSQSVPPERDVNPITWHGSKDQTHSTIEGRWTSKACKEQNSSLGALRAMNFEVVACEQREERKTRLLHEPRFAALCAVTEDHARTASRTCSSNGSKYGNASKGVSVSLCWQD